MKENIKEFSIPFRELNVTAAKVLKFLKIHDSDLYEYSCEHLNTFLEVSSDKADVRGGFAYIDSGRLFIDSESIRLDEKIFNSGKIITSRLKHSRAAALFVVTAGEYFENESRRYINEGNTYTGYLLDAAASEIAEAAAEWMEAKIVEFAAETDMKTTSRYSPGYCGWTVAEQHKLFSFLPAGFCGIKLTESALMIPIKSVSGIVGIGANVKKEDYQCAVCDDLNCFRRNI